MPSLPLPNSWSTPAAADNAGLAQRIGPPRGFYYFFFCSSSSSSSSRAASAASAHQHLVPAPAVCSLNITRAWAAAADATDCAAVAPSEGTRQRFGQAVRIRGCSQGGECQGVGNWTGIRGFGRGSSGRDAGSVSGLFKSGEGAHPEWRLRSNKSRKSSYGRSEGVLADETHGSEVGGRGVRLDLNNGGAGAAGGGARDGVSERGASEYVDGFCETEILDGVDGGNPCLAGESVAGQSQEFAEAELVSEEGGYWGNDGEESRGGGTNGWASPSTAVEGTTEVMEKEATERFRLRNGREVFEERAYIVGIDRKGAGGRALFGIKDSLEELTQLADTAGLAVVGSTYQKLETPNPKTYIGGGKVAEVKAAIHAFKAETVIFDDELSPGQARNLEKAFGDDVRVCDRTALILDIFSQRAATREATLQDVPNYPALPSREDLGDALRLPIKLRVELAQFEYQLPRLTKMWTHLERQAGGMVKGMGEKQIEVDKRILRMRMAALRKDLESVREHRQQYRDRRAAVPIPVVSLVGYTNAGKSTFLNRLSGANVLAEDRLFATLDPTTRRVELPNGKECLFTDTVGFIQKLPTQLVAAFRATLEEITDSSVVLHIVDISHPMAAQQIKAVESVLAELEVDDLPMLTVWNKIDKAEDPERWQAEAAKRDNVVCISAMTGEGMGDFYGAVEQKMKDLMVWVEAVVPYGQGDLVNIIHRLGIVDHEEYLAEGTVIRAHVPLALSRQLLPLRQALI